MTSNKDEFLFGMLSRRGLTTAARYDNLSVKVAGGDGGP